MDGSGNAPLPGYRNVNRQTASEGRVTEPLAPRCDRRGLGGANESSSCSYARASSVGVLGALSVSRRSVGRSVGRSIGRSVGRSVGRSFDPLDDKAPVIDLMTSDQMVEPFGPLVVTMTIPRLLMSCFWMGGVYFPLQSGSSTQLIRVNHRPRLPHSRPRRQRGAGRSYQVQLSFPRLRTGRA